MNFTQVKLNAIEAAQQFALMSPTLHLSSDGTLTRLSESIIGYDVITFGSCTTCSYDSNFSSPDAIYYGQGNWNGPMGMSWPSKLIINVSDCRACKSASLTGFYAPIDSGSHKYNNNHSRKSTKSRNERL